MSDEEILAFIESYDENLKDIVNGLLIERHQAERIINRWKELNVLKSEALQAAMKNNEYITNAYLELLDKDQE